ncbi:MULTISPECIES: nucleoside recognition domain-containing protein [Bacillus]|jgi:spore maturation protein A|uniref:Spore maturation protein n=1 Tax=Bacillus licheniformis (strain ATCC 14580 / DSM 13 / JCM 2505 / CCUG 7422 / NBRC 12200 / NCIMB 9375 / NCTC 10341 / NRRL NRS-1264 / Gibson 46) TaxID=279010 RepID=Q65HX5_BACLD|nr:MULTISPECIES: nucleoside recognition domain-containing protein [Bacillus]AAU23985.1 spore maturation protein [Bacillus licheniformis DSM 13 = ATCC 14580]AAU41339.1 spore maturation protein SpmA [Bacillus licheniformis DSM 13 = ATCC 14580]ARC74061.1 spore maturation protein A [Bacillus licheniformis]ARW43202.1 Spore maturation protein [Bacillus licheniformis]ARW54565.1 Spore maturation protein [Bacillus licheniformis]
MVNIIWVGLTVIGLVFALFNGTVQEVNEAVFKGSKEAVTIVIGLMSVLVFWLGLMKIAEQSGLLEKFSRLCRPFISKLFPEIPPDHPAMGYILSNLMANFFGLGNAATPLGIKAMEQMKALNRNRREASRSMITFLAVNTSSITLIPTTVIAVRMTYDAKAPTDIVGPTILATLISGIFAIFIDRYFYYRRKKKG